MFSQSRNFLQSYQPLKHDTSIGYSSWVSKETAKMNHMVHLFLNSFQANKNQFKSSSLAGGPFSQPFPSLVLATSALQLFKPKPLQSLSIPCLLSYIANYSLKIKCKIHTESDHCLITSTLAQATWTTVVASQLVSYFQPSPPSVYSNHSIQTDSFKKSIL